MSKVKGLHKVIAYIILFLFKIGRKIGKKQLL